MHESAKNRLEKMGKIAASDAVRASTPDEFRIPDFELSY